MITYTELFQLLLVAYPRFCGYNELNEGWTAICSRKKGDIISLTGFGALPL